MWGVDGTEVVEAETRCRVSFDGDDGMRLRLHHFPDVPRAPCAGVYQESCLGLYALGRRRKRRGRSASRDGRSYGRWALCHRSVFCVFGYDAVRRRAKGREGRACHCKQAT